MNIQPECYEPQQPHRAVFTVLSFADGQRLRRSFGVESCSRDFHVTLVRRRRRNKRGREEERREGRRRMCSNDGGSDGQC